MIFPRNLEALRASVLRAQQKTLLRRWCVGEEQASRVGHDKCPQKLDHGGCASTNQSTNSEWPDDRRARVALLPRARPDQLPWDHNSIPTCSHSLLLKLKISLGSLKLALRLPTTRRLLSVSPVHRGALSRRASRRPTVRPAGTRAGRGPGWPFDVIVCKDYTYCTKLL